MHSENGNIYFLFKSSLKCLITQFTFFAFLFYNVSVFSKTLPPPTKPIKIRSTTGYNINAAYQKAMEKIFDFLVSASKNSKTSKDLYNKLFKI